MRSLIIGGSGFVGPHLAEYLGETTDVDVVDLKMGVDVRKYEHMRLVLDDLRPDYVYYLAAVTSIPEAVAEPQRCIDTNISGALNVLEAIRKLGLKTKVLLVSSTEAPTANNPYGMSKMAMEQLGQFYANTYGIHVVSTRTCNHTGPGQEATFAVPSFARQIALIEADAQEELVHGDLDVWKNYLDVRDVVKAYQLAIDLPPNTYTISSRSAVSMGIIIDELIKLSKVEVKTRLDEKLIRPYKQAHIEHKTSPEIDTLWMSKYKLKETLKETLDYWRARTV